VRQKTTKRRSLLQRAWRKWTWRVALVAGLAPFAVGTLQAQQVEKPRLLMLPIIVHSAEPPDYVRGGLADMLSARFARTGALELVRVDDPARGTTQLEQAIAAGRRADADYVLFGSFTRFGKGASLDVQCAPVVSDASREPLREIFVHSGSIGEIIPDLDELVGKVSRFARGEAVASVGAPAMAAPASTVPASDLAEMRERIESLEATVTELLQGRTDAELAEAPGDEGR
jgi:hypothetical protein